MRPLAIATCLAALLACAGRGAAGEPEPTGRQLSLGPVSSVDTNWLVVRSYPLNPYNRLLDGQWQGSIVASDGNCYFASSTHSMGSGSAFFRYEPRKRALTCLCADIGALGDPVLGTPR